MLEQFNHEWTRMNTDFSDANSNTLKIPKGLNQSAQRWCDGGRAQAPTLGNVPQNNSFSHRMGRLEPFGKRRKKFAVSKGRRPNEQGCE
jgi:hypothetical protein